MPEHLSRRPPEAVSRTTPPTLRGLPSPFAGPQQLDIPLRPAPTGRFQMVDLEGLSDEERQILLQRVIQRGRRPATPDRPAPSAPETPDFVAQFQETLGMFGLESGDEEFLRGLFGRPSTRTTL